MKNNLRLAVDIHQDSPYISFSFSIGSGRFLENDEIFGFTHLLEHCIFAPNIAYPSIGQLTEFVDNNGGHINAWTDDLSTNFHFICPLNAALDAFLMLTDKIINPVFDKNNIEAEISAIDAEFLSKKSDEARRLISVQKTICSDEHPYKRFTTGNRETLTSRPTEEVISQLKEFHQARFVANNMALAISLPDTDKPDVHEKHSKLLDNVAQCLEKLPTNKYILAPKYSVAFEPQLQHKLISIKSRSNALIISLMLDKCQTEALDDLALTMLESILSSRHQGGFVDVINSKFELVEFAVKNGFDDQHQTEIQLCMGFTKHISTSEVVSIYNIFSDYIAFLSLEKTPLWRFREKQKQMDLQALFANKTELMDRTIELAEKIRNQVCEEEDENIALESEEVRNRLHQILEHFLEQKLCFYQLTSDGEFKNQTSFYDVAYSVEVIDQNDKHNDVNHSFVHAPQNTYLPSSIEVFQPKGAHAGLMQKLPDYYGWKAQSLRLDYWFCYKDNKPLGDIYVSFISEAMFGDEKIAVAKRIWMECVQEHLKSYFFQTNDAGLYYKIYGHQRGFSIQTSGFTDRQLLLLYELINQITQCEITEKGFERGRIKVGNKISRILWQKPVNKLFSTLSESVHSSTMNPEDMLNALADLDFEEFSTYQKRFFNSINIEALMVGNWPLALGDRLKAHLADRFAANYAGKEISIPDVTHAFPSAKVIPIENSNDHAFMLFQSFGETDRQEAELKPLALSLLIEAFLSPLFFVEMRNIRRVGYNLGVGYKPIERHAGIVVYAQSPNLGKEELKTQIIDGLSTVIENARLNGIDFSSLQNLVCEQINQPAETASALGRYIWQHFDNPDPLNYVNTLRACVNSIEETDFWENCNSLLSGNSRQLILQTEKVISN